MSPYSKISDRRAMFLRRNAENRLSAGSSPPGSGTPLDRDALSLLYEMAGDPERSTDAFRLLHELQVHQVELDLQREELQNNELEMSRELALYRELVDRTPSVCLVASMDGQIIQANPAAAELLSTGQIKRENPAASGLDCEPENELMGRMLQSFLTRESQASWNELLQTLTAEDQAASCEVMVDTGSHESVALRLSVSVSPEGEAVVLAVAGR